MLYCVMNIVDTNYFGNIMLLGLALRCQMTLSPAQDNGPYM